MVQDFNAEIISIKDLSNTVKEFTFDLGDNLEFKAGQFVNLAFQEDGETYKRPYSISSAPTDISTISLCIKLVENGKVTPKLFKKQVGDYVDIKGALGVFNSDKITKEKVVFIGTGTGIAPLRSMIIDELSKQNEILEGDMAEGVAKTKEITLIFGVRYENEILYKEEFEEIAKLNPNFKYIQVVSKPTDKWEGRTGHVQENFDTIDILNSNIFICGLPAMYDSSKEKLIQMGIPEKEIFHEVFR